MKSMLIGAVVCLQLSALLLAAPAADQQTLSACADQTLTITVDNKILELYIDGTPASPENADEWTLAGTANVPALAEVIALKAEDVGVTAGILASGSNFVSDGSWKCTNTFYSGWQIKNFDDSSWPFAKFLGPHGVSPWGKIAGIRDDAYWIWTYNHVYGPDSDKVIYCRKHLPDCVDCAGGGTGSSCITSCVGRTDGDYQSCKGCDVYATCSNGILFDNRPCAASGLPNPLQWDDSVKRCEWSSTTCKECGDGGTKPGCSGVGTGPRCITSCSGRADGDYQSCHGCHEYATCSNGYLYDNRPCALNTDGSLLVWDDNLKRCEYTSPTCNCD